MRTWRQGIGSHFLRGGAFNAAPTPGWVPPPALAGGPPLPPGLPWCGAAAGDLVEMLP